jgi:glycosyltransferase involved in cell wall biosynthesis
MRVLLITIHYPPVLGNSARGMAELSKALIAEGHMVDVLTIAPPPDHPVYRVDAAEMQHVPSSVNVHRVAMGPLNRLVTRIFRYAASGSNRRFSASASEDNSPSARSGSHTRSYRTLLKIKTLIQHLAVPDLHFDWIPGAVREARRMLRRNSYDVVASFGYPHTSHCVAYLALRGYQIPWIMMHAEGWSKNPAMQQLDRCTRRIHTAIDQKISRAAGRIVFCGWVDGVSGTPQAPDGVDPQKLRVAQFSFVDPDPYEAIPASSIGGTHVVYTGALYAEHKQDPKEFFEAIAKFGPGEIRLSILGNVDPKFEQFVLDRNIANVEFLGWCPRDTVIRYQRRANLLLLFGCVGGQLVPSKIYEYFLARAPILCVSPDGDDVTSRLVSKHRRGIVVPNARQAISSALSSFRQIQLNCEVESYFDLREMTQYTSRHSAQELLHALLDPISDVKHLDGQSRATALEVSTGAS